MAEKDHCTMFFEYVFGHYIGGCCLKHDVSYAIKVLWIFMLGLAIALIEYQYTGVWNWVLFLFYPLGLKMTYDLKLLICITKVKWYLFPVGILMFIAVSLFGWIFFGLAQLKLLVKGSNG